MNLFRLLLVLALMPVTAYSGLPHIACRCSNGDLHLYCPKLTRATQSCRSQSSSANSAQKATRSCCHCASQETLACDKADEPQGCEATCCQGSCQCTAVALADDAGPVPVKVLVPEVVQAVLEFVPFLNIQELNDSCRASLVADIEPHSAVDIVIVYERILI